MYCQGIEILVVGQYALRFSRQCPNFEGSSENRSEKGYVENAAKMSGVSIPYAEVLFFAFERIKRRIQYMYIHELQIHKVLVHDNFWAPCW